MSRQNDEELRIALRQIQIPEGGNYGTYGGDGGCVRRTRLLHNSYHPTCQTNGKNRTITNRGERLGGTEGSTSDKLVSSLCGVRERSKSWGGRRRATRVKREAGNPFRRYHDAVSTEVVSTWYCDRSTHLSITVEHSTVLQEVLLLQFLIFKVPIDVRMVLIREL